MFQRNRRSSVISIATLAVLAITAGAMLWFVTGPGTASAHEEDIKVHGDFAFGFDAGNGTSLSVQEIGTDPSQVTGLGYTTPAEFGFGTIPDDDFSDGLAQKTLNTDTSRITYTSGPFPAAVGSGPITATFVGDGTGPTKKTGQLQSFGFGDGIHTVTDVGLQFFQPASVNGVVQGVPLVDPNGGMGKHRINRKIRH